MTNINKFNMTWRIKTPIIEEECVSQVRTHTGAVQFIEQSLVLSTCDKDIGWARGLSGEHIVGGDFLCTKFHKL